MKDLDKKFDEMMKEFDAYCVSHGLKPHSNDIKAFIKENYIARDDVIELDTPSVKGKSLGEVKYITVHVNGEWIKLYTKGKILEMIGEDREFGDKRMCSDEETVGFNQANKEIRAKLK